MVQMSKNSAKGVSARKVERAVVTAGGRERSLIVVGPENVANGSPAILFFRGSNQTAELVRRFSGHTFDDLTGRGAVVAYLMGTRGTGTTHASPRTLPLGKMVSTMWLSQRPRSHSSSTATASIQRASTPPGSQRAAPW